MWAALLLVVFLAFPASAFAATYPAVPDPPFGAVEQPGTVTHYVDSSNPRATDTNNPSGTAAKPRKTVPTTLPAGAVVEVRGGPYAITTATWTSTATQARPAFVIGVNSPVFTGNGIGHRVKLAGSYLVLRGLVFRGVQVDMIGAGLALRDSEVTLNTVTAVVAQGRGMVVLRNHIHDNGNPNGTTENDSHGIKVVPGSTYSWILDNEIHHNGGDSVQVGDAQRTEPFAQWVFIAGNRMHEDRENAVDVKAARDVFISQNVMWGYQVRSSSAGEVVVVHNMPSRVFVLGNVLGLSNQGIVCSGADGYFVLGNVIAGVKHAAGATYDPGNIYGASAILTYGSERSYHLNNTVWDSDAGISVPNGVTEVTNNVVAKASQATPAVRLGTDSQRAASIVGNNYFGPDPGFVDAVANDFHLRAGSAMIDRGTAHWIWQAFLDQYHVPMADVYGMPRVSGGKVDMGAAEFQK